MKLGAQRLLKSSKIVKPLKDSIALAIILLMGISLSAQENVKLIGKVTDKN
jgi:hypothetical protein